jgi:hypothetical protein
MQALLFHSFAAELGRWAYKAVTYEFLAILIGGIEYR